MSVFVSNIKFTLTTYYILLKHVNCLFSIADWLMFFHFASQNKIIFLMLRLCLILMQDIEFESQKRVGTSAAKVEPIFKLINSIVL